MDRIDQWIAHLLKAAIVLGIVAVICLTTVGLNASEELATIEATVATDQVGPVAPTPLAYESTGVAEISPKKVAFDSLPQRLRTALIANVETPAAEPADLLDLNQREIRLVVLAASQRYSSFLQSQAAGEQWRAYFQLEKLERLLSANEDPQGFAQPREDIDQVQLQTTLNALSNVDSRDAYRSLTGNSYFITLRRSLDEAVKSTDDRLKRKHFHRSVLALSKRLESEPEVGASWRAYFKLPFLSEVSATPKSLSKSERQQLAAALARFQKTSADRELRPIAALPGFAGSYRGLQQIFGVEASESARLALVPDIGEVLPEATTAAITAAPPSVATDETPVESQAASPLTTFGRSTLGLLAEPWPLANVEDEQIEPSPPTKEFNFSTERNADFPGNWSAVRSVFQTSERR